MSDVLGLPAIRSQKPIYLHEAFVARPEIRYFSESANEYVPWAGTDVRVRFSVEPTGYTDAGYPSTLFGPYDLLPTSEDGVYFATISADDIMRYLGTLVGTIVYMIVEGQYGSGYYDLSVVQPLLVVDPQAPLP